MDDAPDTGTRRFLTFRAGGGRYALPAARVAEVIRIPALARVPQAPPGLLGLGNLRGTVLPVASLRGLLGLPAAPAERAVVLDGPSPVALAVDAVDALIEVGHERVETGRAALAAEGAERLEAAIRSDDADGGTVKVLDIEGLLAAAFAPAARPARPPSPVGRPAPGPDAPAGRMLVTFEAAGQEYALALDDVEAIAELPATLAALPRAESLLLGVAAFRDGLLPVMTLRGLLGLPPAAGRDGREKMLVATIGATRVGLVADRMRDILRADAGRVEPAPALLSARTGEARVAAIFRADGGRRLVPILSPDLMFREDVMRRLGEIARGAPAAPAPARAERQVLVLRLGDEEFGLPIEAVDEVRAVPEQVTRVPRTPAFVEGVTNLRGAALPVVDQRRRFGMPPAPPDVRRRMVVVRTERHRAGLLVDDVVEVLRVGLEQIGPAPVLSGEPVALVSGVINLDVAGRMVLLLDPAELLGRSERAMLDAIGGEAGEERRDPL